MQRDVSHRVTRIAIRVNFAPAPVLYDLAGYGSLGRGGKDSILNGLKQAIENAIADYVEVNFLSQ